jgi:hypothetical protein
MAAFSKGETRFYGVISILVPLYTVIAVPVQLYSVNKSLYYTLPTLCLPLSYSVHTVLSLLNALIYFDQLEAYTPFQYSYLGIGLFLLLRGVWKLRVRQH